MLKLERISYYLPSTTLRFREKEHFLNLQFLKALLLALIVHLGGLCIFQISPLRLSSTFLFPPIQVQSNSSPTSISTLVTSNPLETDDLPPPPFSLIPPFHWINTPVESSLHPSLELNLETFQFIEERVWPTWNFPLSLPLEEPIIRLTVSGDLAERPLIQIDPLLNLKQLMNTVFTPIEMIYQVQIDERTGQIFWYERLQSNGDAHLNQLTEKILLNLRFSTASLEEAIKGNVHFIITGTLDSL